MLSVDLSKAIPRIPGITSTSFIYLVALIPGLFFELSVFLANPEPIANVLSRPQLTFKLNVYLEFGIFLFFAFVIGNLFILLVTPTLQFFVERLYLFWVLLREAAVAWIVIPLLSSLHSERSWSKFRKLGTIQRLEQRILEDDPAVALRGAQGCWFRLANKLLKTRYGLTPGDVDPDEWQWIYWSVGSPTPYERRGLMFMIALHATGWCGLAATKLAPALRNRHYLILCTLLVGVGLTHSFVVARQRHDLLSIAVSRIRALLREYEKIYSGTGPETAAGSASPDRDSL